MKGSLLAGTALATAVGLMVVGGPALAQSTGSKSQQAQVKCMGANNCSGQSACKTATSPGPGQNSCKGQGFILTSSVKECQTKGGKPS